MKEEILKNKVKECIDDYISIKSIIFTTYEFETEFFEMQLLPYLFGFSDEKNMENYELLVAAELDKKFKENGIDIFVYYDHLTKNPISCVKYKAKQVYTKKGVFHPKLIIITGTKRNTTTNVTTVIVSSANLTTSSYKTNLEVVGIVEKKGRKLVQDLCSSEDIFKILSTINSNFDEIYITGLQNNTDEEINDKTEMFNAKFINSKNLKVLTPFLDTGIIECFLKNHKQHKNLDIIFTKLRGINSSTKKYDDEKNNKGKLGIRLYNGERKIHAKAYILNQVNSGQELIIGSHNFTQNAICGINVEASLSIKKSGLICEFKEFINDIEEKNTTECKLENVTLIDGEDSARREKCDVQIDEAIVNWDDGNITIKLNSNKDLPEKIIVQIGSNKITIENKNCVYTYLIAGNSDLQESIIKNKFFCISSCGNEWEISGIFWEEGEIDKSNAIHMNDFISLLEAIRKGDVKRVLKRDYEAEYQEGAGENEEENNYEENNYDVVNLFLAFRKINEDIECAKNQNIELHKLYMMGPKSVANLINVFINNKKEQEYEKMKECFKNKNKKQKREEKCENQKEKYQDVLLYYFLTCNELVLLMNRYQNECTNSLYQEELKNLYEEELGKTFKELKELVREQLDFERKEEREKALEIYIKNLK